MSADLVGSILPAAIAFAVSPVAIVEMILILFSRRARVNGVVFLLVVFVPTVLIPLAGARAYEAAADSSGSTTSAASGWFLLAFAALLAFLALGNWRKRADQTPPAIFAKIEGMGPGAVAFLALGVTVMNPKNLALLLAVGRSLGASQLTGTSLLIAVLAFALLGMAPFLVVVGFGLFGGASAQGMLERWKHTLLAKNRLIMAVVLGVLAAVLVVNGLRAVLA